MADVLGKKISELAETTDLAGLYTIGSDRNNQSKKVPLQFVKEAADYANAQGDYAKGVGDTIQGNTGVNEYPAFSSSTQYAAGSVVRYNNKLYRFTALHPAGAWVGTDAIETSIKAETDVKLTELESEAFMPREVLPEMDLNDVKNSGLFLLDSTRDYGNLPFTKGYAGFLRVTNTQSGFLLQEVYLFSGATFYKRRGSTNGTFESWQEYPSSDAHMSVLSPLPSGDLNKVGGNKSYLLADSNTYENTPYPGAIGFLRTSTINSYVLQEFFPYTGGNMYKRRGSKTTYVFEEWQEVSPNGVHTSDSNLLASCDLNNVGGNVSYLLVDSETYENAPYENAVGFLRTSTMFGYTLQEFYPFSNPELYKRRGQVGKTWTDWGKISGGNTIVNQYPSYNNNYEITCNPQINAGSDNVLVSSNNTNDRSADIVSMLNTTGVCRLGVGTFYVTNINMPDDSLIVGMGAATKLILTSSASYALKMAKRCSIKDLHIMGATADITISESISERHGILWQGNYAENQSNAMQPQRGHIDNVWISRLTGGGITCYNTGYGTICHLVVNNVNIWNCNAGINISYWSEFHKFTNVRCGECYFGCINNGGNNVFVNCDFSSNKGIAFLMDNAGGKSPNNSHGSAIGCVFNHTNSNKGIGIKIISCENGYIFSGCQVFYSQIVIEDSYGIVVSNTNFGQANCDITIVKGASILFANNIFGGTPIITNTNNTTTRFVNCYDRNTGAEIVA